MTKDQIKTQAKKLVSLLQAHQGPVQYQDALELLAQLNGFRNWKTLSASLSKESAPGAGVQPEPAVEETRGLRLRVPDEHHTFVQAYVPGTGFLYRVPITVDVTQSALVLVRAEDEDDAIELAKTLVAEGGAPMELDDGNYRGRADYYCPDRQEGVYRVQGEVTVPTQVTETGVQVGPFYVELAALSDEDTMLWAELSVFHPGSDEALVIGCLSSMPVTAPKEERTQLCRSIAVGLLEKFGVADADAVGQDDVFRRLAQG